MGKRIDLMGVPVDALTMAETVARVAEIIEEGTPRQHMAVNAGKVVKMLKDVELREVVLNSDLLNADGAAIVYASRILGTPLPERVTGIDLMEHVVRMAAEKGYKPYFLGAKRAIVERVVEIYRERYPSLEIAGFRDGYFTAEEEQRVAETVRDSGAHILFVAMSSPKKETFLGRHMQTMNVPFCMGVGGSFDVVAGKVQRAPAWMRENGLEWAYRLKQEPRRMLRRNAIESPKFVALVLRARLGRFRMPR